MNGSPVQPRASDLVLETPCWEIDRTTVKSAEGFILNRSRGGPHHRDNMGHRVKVALREMARSTGVPQAGRLKPHELRATFITLARQAGCDERYLKRYVGHSPGDIMGTHYEAVAVEDMRRRVVDVFLGAYGEKLNAERMSCTVCCTIAAQTRPLASPGERVSAI